jgi:DNA repair protein RecO (recombination protein O)
MPTYATTGIVIGRTNLGEADRIVRFYTPDHGKLSAVARGVRKIRSRMAGHLEPFGETSLMLATGKSLDVITSARLLWYPHTLAAQHGQLNLAFMMGVGIDRLTEPGQPHPQLYAVLREALGALDASPESAVPLIELWFKLRLINELGYRPELGRCLVCGAHDQEFAYSFDPVRGGIVCATDAQPDNSPMELAAIKLWRLLCDYPYASISRVANSPQLAAQTLPPCDRFIEHHLGLELRAG